MSSGLKIGLAQHNFCVGDLKENKKKILELVKVGKNELGFELIVFPELALTGYPPEDLLLRPEFGRLVKSSLDEITDQTKGCSIIVGYPEYVGSQIFNSAAVISNGSITANYRKRELPNYAVFDEKRYFTPGSHPTVVEIKGVNIGISICEDIWVPRNAVETAKAGAKVICNINASPYHLGKLEERREAVSRASNQSKIPILYVNLLGGQDELVFDGSSFGVNPQGEIIARAPAFEEALHSVDIKKTDHSISIESAICNLPSEEELVYQALILGIRDYVEKNRFEGCVIGLSGGIDSALTLALAVDALGKEKVRAISMPSDYTASMSVDDAREEASLLGCDFHILPIQKTVSTFCETLSELLPNLDQGVTKQNIQARARGVLLMACSNASNSIVLATGNKSEMAVGYATLYGDMAGGFAPLKDIPKTLVYRLSNFRNQKSYVIPKRVINREPTAELAPDQRDSDNLPPYNILDPILERYIERDMNPFEISEAGFDLNTVTEVSKLVDRNEYKRRQAAPGVRITKRAFGRDRRFPITSRYSELKS